MLYNAIQVCIVNKIHWPNWEFWVKCETAKLSSIFTLLVPARRKYRTSKGNLKKKQTFVAQLYDPINSKEKRIHREGKLHVVFMVVSQFLLQMKRQNI